MSNDKIASYYKLNALINGGINHIVSQYSPETISRLFTADEISTFFKKNNTGIAVNNKTGAAETQKPAPPISVITRGPVMVL